MAHPGETLHKNVSCIADLKALGSKNLPVMVKGMSIAVLFKASNH